MKALFGIDVGTTAVKAVLIDPSGHVLASATTDCPLSTPYPGWSEQDPAVWWDAAITSVRRALQESGTRAAEIAALGLTGQMHGLVVLDTAGDVLRPAILWNDQRTADECAWITERVGTARIIELTANPMLTGFTAPKIVWIRRNEPDVYAGIAHVLLPKDYVRFRLTGRHVTDVADASGTALFDVRRRAWSREMIEALEVPVTWLPEVVESPVPTGTVTTEAAAATGLAVGTPVVGGAGDQAAQAVGTGIVRPGIISAAIGTSGVVFAALDEFRVDPEGRLHSFCHAVPVRWHVMGVMLSAGGSLRWLRDTLQSRSWLSASVNPYDLMSAEAGEVPPGSSGLLFLPYLTGERTPHADPHARGAFVGLTIRHQRGHLVRAVMEGVAMGLRDSLEILREMGLSVTQVRVSGGGARSAVWRQILADFFRVEVVRVTTTEGAAFGAALLAGVGVGLFASVEAASDAAVCETDRTVPDVAHADAYDRTYAVYRSLYPGLRETMHRLHALER